jgi:predicted secreted protein
MGIVNALFIYILVWWLVIFTVLPIGIERHTDAALGHDAGAPKDPRLAYKIKLTSIVSAIIVGILWLMVDFDVITWGEWFRVK